MSFKDLTTKEAAALKPVPPKDKDTATKAKATEADAKKEAAKSKS